MAIVLGVLALGYLAVVALAFLAQRSLLYPVPKEVSRPSAASQLIELPETVLLVRPPPSPGAPVLVHFHGNGEQLAWTEWMADRLASNGIGAVMVEYPGYGLAREKGRPTEESIVRAAEAAIAWTRTNLNVSDDRLVLSGQSLGSGVAVHLAARGVGSRLVLWTPYTSLPDVAAGWLPFLPVRLLMLDRFDSLSKAGQIRQPTLILHGTRDEVVPFSLGERLSRALPQAKLLVLEGGRHNDLGDRPEAWAAVIPFVRPAP